jgi:hypothetical protein
MTDYADIYYVDGRNAVVDHRTGQPQRVMVPSGSLGGRAIIAQSPYGQGPMAYGPQGPYGQWNPAWGHPGYHHSSLLGRISAGQLIDMVAQIFVALMPLPAGPSVTGDAGTDVGNLILYQGSLASYAKRDEQVRTLGNLVSKLVG